MCFNYIRNSPKLVTMPHNGPAIWGVCVGRRSIRAGSWYPVPSTREGQKVVTVQGGHGTCFCSPGTNCRKNTSVALQFYWGAGCKSRYTKFYWKQWRSPGLSCFTKLSKEQERFAKTVTNK